MRVPLWMALVALAAAGCAEAPAPAVAPTFAMGARRAMPWQQFCEQAVSVPQASALAAARGADGWELVAMYNGVLCYKRPAGPVVSGIPVATPGSGSNRGSSIHIIPDPGF
jgi:hypothetical protein